MKSLVIYVWGRLGGKNLGLTHAGFQEVGPLEQGRQKSDLDPGRLLPANPPPYTKAT